MENIIKEFLKEKNAEHLYEDFMDLLVCYEPLRYKIFRDYERDCHREDVRIELENEGIEIKDEDVEEIVEWYEDRLLDDENWHFILNETIYDYYDKNKGENENE